MKNTLLRETPLLSDALREITALLPPSWRVEWDEGAPVAGRSGGTVLSLIGPDGASVPFLIEARQSGGAMRLLLANLREQASASDRPLLFVSDYIGPSLRDALATEGISYADATGWVRIVSDTPLVLLTGRGAGRSPNTGMRTTTIRLNGVAAGRIIRTLCTQDAPLGVRALATLADVSPGSVSKLLATLARESIIDRDDRGTVVSVRRRALVRRWVQDYSYATTNGPVGRFIAPRGLDRTLRRMTDLPSMVTVTGSAAARRLLPEGTTPVVPLRLLALYTDAPATVVDQLGLIPADPVTANVVITAPQDLAVLGDAIAPVALVLADLLTLPGRGDAEAEQLMDALARDDGAWEA